MSKTIWDLVISAGNAFDDVERTPYLTPGQNNYFQLACKSSRASKKREHVLNHCFAMVNYCLKEGQYPLS